MGGEESSETRNEGKSTGSEKREPTGSETRTENGTRRRFLQALGAASAVAGVGAGASAQETTTDGDGQGTPADDDGQETTTAEGDDQTTTVTDATTIVLGGRTEYWLGLAPEPIEGEQNPTLQLREGERYRLVWVNLDGVEHELIVQDGEGEELVESDSNEQVGATASVAFTAGEEMAEYYCEYHPERMRGSVELGEGFETTTEADEGETTTEETTVADGEVVDVAVGPDGQYLKFVPEEVEISVGDTVRWTAESEGHNVTAKEEAATKVELPDGAEPFASYEGSRSFLVMEVGEAFEHTLTVPGTYVYVCAPHASEGMVGRVIVNE